MRVKRNKYCSKGNEYNDDLTLKKLRWFIEMKRETDSMDRRTKKKTINKKEYNFKASKHEGGKWGVDRRKRIGIVTKVE